MKPTPQTILYMRTKKEILHTGMEILFNKRKLNWSKVMDGTTATTLILKGLMIDVVAQREKTYKA
jgi:hypothetical protein